MVINLLYRVSGPVRDGNRSRIMITCHEGGKKLLESQSEIMYG